MSTAAVLKHGHARWNGKSPEYRCWRHINIRCHNPNSKSYPRYGGRGITVCAQWRSDFSAFFAEMGPKPSPEHSIERVKNDKGYEPGNCIWATKTEQSRNRRSSKLTVDDVAEIRRCLALGQTNRSLAVRFGVSAGMIGHIKVGRLWR